MTALFTPNDAHAQGVFLRVAYAVMFLSGLYFFPIREEIFGPETLVRPFFAEPSLKLNIAYLLNNNRAYAVGAYYAYLIATVFAFFNWGWRIPRVAVFVLGNMLYFACTPAFTSGWLLYNLFAFYLIFLSPRAKHVLAVFVSNLAFLACRLQFLLVYIVAGLTKLTGTTWLDGSAIYYALHLSYYGNASPSRLIEVPLLLQLLTWSWLVFQLLMPVMIWWKPARIWLFVYALLMHGFIALGMNLPDFGLGMIAAYSLFITASAAYRLDAWASAVRRKISPKTVLQ